MLEKGRLQIKKEETRKNVLRCSIIAVSMVMYLGVGTWIESIYDEYISSCTIEAMWDVLVIAFMAVFPVWLMCKFSTDKMKERIQKREHEIVCEMKADEILSYVREFKKAELKLNYDDAVEAVVADEDVNLFILLAGEKCYDHIYVSFIKFPDTLIIWAELSGEKIWYYTCFSATSAFLGKYFELMNE